MSADAPIVVECVAVTRVFGSGPTAHTAVAEATLTLHAGQRVSLVGPSGSGKSTLLHLLAGLDRPTSGHLSWPSLASGAELPSERTGVVFQAPSLIGNLSVIENVEIPLLITDRPARLVRELAMAALDQLDLAELADRLPEDLSGGQAQRVAIARALARNPLLILADEPTGQLDRNTGAHVIDVLLTASQLAGAALVIATHDQAVAAKTDEQWNMTDGSLATSPLAGVRP
jgi:putative ABC transport system ATP-binding protein